MAKQYAKTHEWVDIQDDGTALLGLSQFACQELGDIVFLNPGEVGQELRADDAFGEVESVKSVSDLIAPFDARIAEVNQALVEAPEQLGEKPEAPENWIVRLENFAAVEGLMDAEAYRAFVETEA